MFQPTLAFRYSPGWLYMADEGCLYADNSTPLVYQYCPAGHVLFTSNLIILYRQCYLPAVAEIKNQKAFPVVSEDTCSPKMAPPIHQMFVPAAAHFSAVCDLDFFLRQHPAFESLLRRL